MRGLRVRALARTDEIAMDEHAHTTTDVAAALVAHHRDLLAFVERRVRDRALAEEILQDAFVRGLEKSDEIRESALGWMYRMLRNAIVDRARRAAVQQQRLEALAAEMETQSDTELEEVACKCVATLAQALKPEYADALQRIDVDGVAVKDYATERGISASNAGVRVFRARDALRAQLAKACGTCATHGCVDCTCQTDRALVE